MSVRSVPGLPRRRVGRPFAVFAAAAVALGIWVWRSGGEVKPAVASTVEAAQDAGLDAPTYATPTPAPVHTTGTAKPAPTTALRAKRPAATPAAAVAAGPAARAKAPAPKATMNPMSALPAPSPANTTVIETTEDAIDPEHISTSIRELIGNDQKPDLDP